MISSGTFCSLTDFAAALPARIASRERDFGSRGARGRQLGEREEGGGHVELLAAGADLARTRRAVPGWRTCCGRDGSLEWLRQRAERLTTGR